MVVRSGEDAILVEFRTAVRGIQERRLTLLLPDGLVKVIEPLTGGHSERITIEPFQRRRGILRDVGSGVLLTIGTRENTRKILEKDIHVGRLIGVYDGATGRTEPFGEEMEIGPESRPPLGWLLDQERGDNLGTRGTLATTITGHGLTMWWVIRLSASIALKPFPSFPSYLVPRPPSIIHVSSVFPGSPSSSVLFMLLFVRKALIVPFLGISPGWITRYLLYCGHHQRS